MRWLAALGVILLAFAVFVFMEARDSSSANAGEPQSTPTRDVAPVNATGTPTNTTMAPARVAQPPTMAAVVENIRASAVARASGAPAPSLADSVAASGSGSAGSAERAPDADDYLPYPDGSEPSSFRVKMRGAQRRFNNGNYKGAFEAADSLVQMWPTEAEPFTVAVPALCAMGDTDRATSYFGRVTDEAARKQITEGCAGFGVTLP